MSYDINCGVENDLNIFDVKIYKLFFDPKNACHVKFFNINSKFEVVV